ncbi:MAG: N-acetylmuramidase domain-containing protein [Pseudomonadota bacterium]
MFDETQRSEIEEIAKENALEPAILLALVQVQCRGRLQRRVKGKLKPSVRFEAHEFYQLLPNAKRNLAIVRGLATFQEGRIRNSIWQPYRWKMIGRAEEIDRTAALASCRWGCGEIKGSLWHWLGYASVDGLVEEACLGSTGQVRLLMRYLLRSGEIEKLQRHDWAGFARAFKGPRYRNKKYDRKLIAAYKHYSSGFMMPEVSRRLPARNGMIDLRFGAHGIKVKKLQKDLRKLGYSLKTDGDFGPATERMVRLFQSENDLKVDGVFGPKSYEIYLQKLPAAA